MQDGAAAGAHIPLQVAFQNHGFMTGLARAADRAVQHSARGRRQRAEVARRPRMNELALHHRAVKRRWPLWAAQNSLQLSPEGSRAVLRLPLACQSARDFIVKINRRQPSESRQTCQRRGQIGIKAQQANIDGNPSILEHSTRGLHLRRCRLLQKGINLVPGSHHINAVMASRLRIQPHRDARCPWTVPLHLARVKAQHHVAGGHQQAVGNSLRPRRRKRQRLVEDRRCPARMRARRQHAKELAPRRVLRQPA